MKSFNEATNAEAIYSNSDKWCVYVTILTQFCLHMTQINNHPDLKRSKKNNESIDFAKFSLCI